MNMTSVPIFKAFWEVVLGYVPCSYVPEGGVVNPLTSPTIQVPLDIHTLDATSTYQPVF